MRTILIALLPLSAWAQTLSFSPVTPLQGQVVKVYGGSDAVSVRLNERTIRLFAQSDGSTLGLMPIGVLEKPGTYRLEWLAANGTVAHETDLAVANAHYAKQNIVLSKTLSALKSTSEERELVAAFLKTVSNERRWQEPFEAPIPGCITSPFGVMRLHNGKPTGDFHAGLDQRGPLGSPIHAIAGGTVKIVHEFQLRGGTVAIDHGQGLESIYLHMSKLGAKEGDQVRQGDVIGYVGSTGRSTGPHLHWTLYAYGEPVDPLQWVHLTPCPSTARTPRRRSRKSAPLPATHE